MVKEKNDAIELIGRVMKCLPNTKFLVEIRDTNKPEEKFTVECYLSGKMRVHYIKIIVGDVVTVEMSPYDLSKGRIIYRHNKNLEEVLKEREQGTQEQK
ncbi:translation initiation factor IF-1 [Candidatus Peregrinibacteria bacterium RIFOXYB2_FULL_32_7]|nr:MAG: translation initiation factor IF-1 [Candidatus Peregrinibacteria bacterium RIFOXYB2_FULL_32_7]